MKENLIKYPLEYPKDVIKNMIWASAFKLACWLSSKEASEVLIVPIVNSVHFYPRELMFTEHLLSLIKNSYDVLPITSKGRVPQQYEERLNHMQSKKDIVLIDVISATGHTLKSLRDKMCGTDVDILTIVLLDRQTPGREYCPDISVIQDSRPAWWVGYGLEDPTGQQIDLPYLVGLEPEKNFNNFE